MSWGLFCFARPVITAAFEEGSTERPGFASFNERRSPPPAERAGAPRKAGQQVGLMGLLLCGDSSILPSSSLKLSPVYPGCLDMKDVPD